KSVLGIDTSRIRPDFLFAVSTNGQSVTCPGGASSISYPPIGDLIRIDGRFADWDGRRDVPRLINEVGPHDGYDEKSQRVMGQLSESATIQSLWAFADERYLYLRLGMLGPMDFAKNDYFIFLDVDGSVDTGYLGNWGTVGADYAVWNGVLYQHAGGRDEW